MNSKNVLKIYNQFNRIHSQLSIAKRKLVCNDFSEPIYPAEMQILALLSEHPDYTVSDIASHLFTTKSGASQLVKKLCQKGFLTKKRAPHNERVVLLEHTSMGKKALKKIISNESEALGEVGELLSSLSEKEAKVIQNLFDKLESHLKNKLA